MPRFQRLALSVLVLLSGLLPERIAVEAADEVPATRKPEAEVATNVKYFAAVLPRGWVTYTSRGINARLALPGKPEEKSGAEQTALREKQENAVTLVHHDSRGCETTYAARRVFYPGSTPDQSDDAFFTRAVKDAFVAGEHQLLEPIKTISYGSFHGLALQYETATTDGCKYETRLEVFRDADMAIAYVHSVTAPRGKLSADAAIAFFRNIRLFDADVVSAGGPLVVSERAVAIVPDLKAETVPAPEEWVTHTSKDPATRFAFPTQPKETSSRDRLPGGIIEKDTIDLATPEGIGFTVVRLIFPEDSGRLDDEAFFFKAVEFSATPGTYRQLEPAKRVAYDRMSGRMIRYETDAPGYPGEIWLEVFRDGRVACLAWVSAPRGEMQPEAARAFFRNARWLDGDKHAPLANGSSARNQDRNDRRGR